MTLLERITARPLPAHVAIIMDGNGRWAEARGLPRTAGHRAGAASAERLIRFTAERIGLAHLTLFAFSSENWTRPRSEVDFLMDLLEEFIEEKRGEFIEYGIRLSVAGRAEALPRSLAEVVRRVVEDTAGGEALHLTVALNYGGRQDILGAVRALASDIQAGRVQASEIEERDVADRLDTAGCPDPDLVIRTSGERRLSNFLLWQSAYAELAFVDTFWPDFSPAEFVSVLDDYQSRERRFGALLERRVA